MIIHNEAYRVEKGCVISNFTRKKSSFYLECCVVFDRLFSEQAPLCGPTANDDACVWLTEAPEVGSKWIQSSSVGRWPTITFSGAEQEQKTPPWLTAFTAAQTGNCADESDSLNKRENWQASFLTGMAKQVQLSGHKLFRFVWELMENDRLLLGWEGF